MELVEEQPWEMRKDFLALNPAGTLPVYVDDNMRALCGATVISEFLDETAGVLKRDKRLLAEDPFQRAEIRRLTEWFLVKMEADVTRPLVARAHFQAADAPDTGRRRTGFQGIARGAQQYPPAYEIYFLAGRHAAHIWPATG